MIKQLHTKQRGFTILELLLVIAVLAVLVGIVLIALSPGKKQAETRNSQRQADVATILNAVYQYSSDNNGAIPAGVTSKPTEICATKADKCDKLIDLGVLTNASKYIASLPKDPQCATKCATNGIGYTIAKDSKNRIVIAAPHAESSKAVTVSR